MTDRANLLEWLNEESEAAGEPITHVRFAGPGRGTLAWDDPKCRELLDVDFDDDYGGVEATPIWAWSENYVWVLAMYDGAEWIERVDRHPTTRYGVPRHIGSG